MKADAMGAFLANLATLLQLARRRRSWSEVEAAQQLARDASDGLLEELGITPELAAADTTPPPDE